MCCSGKESLKGKDQVEAFKKIEKPQRTKAGLYAVGGKTVNPHLLSNNLRAGQLPCPTSKKEFEELTKGRFSNLSQRQIRKSNYDELVEQYGKGKQLWTDPDFPPNSKSWGNSREKVVWKRASQIIDSPQLVSNNFTPCDILQGRIGNCYFLSAIAGLAERPYRIKKLFPNTDINSNGIYMARILLRGVYQEVVVDDYFPCSANTGKLLGAQPAGDSQIWVMVLEKCWAKLHGSYDAIDGGLPNEVLHAFSGAPTDNYTLAAYKHNLDGLFAKMLAADQNGEIVCCGTQPENYDGKLEQVGLVGGHAYTVLSVFQEPTRMLKIRNPWGNVEWKGTASDGDTAFWNRISADEQFDLGYTNKDDGTFFMLWEDFDQFFVIVDICHIEDNANYFYQELAFNNGRPLYFNFYTNGGHLTIATSQDSKRYLKAMRKQGKLSNATMILGREVKENEYEYVKSKTTDSQSDLCMQLQQLAEGNYILCCFVDAKSGSSTTATISCYSGSNMSLLTADQSTTTDFLAKCYLDHAHKNEYGKQILSYAPEEWVAFDILTDSCGLGYSAFHVDSKSTRKLGLEFDEEQYNRNGLELLAPYRGSGTFKLVCDKGQQLIVMCRLTPNVFVSECTMPVPRMFRLK